MNEISRRNLLSKFSSAIIVGAIAAPYVIRQSGLLMPVRDRTAPYRPTKDVPVLIDTPWGKSTLYTGPVSEIIHQFRAL